MPPGWTHSPVPKATRGLWEASFRNVSLAMPYIYMYLLISLSHTRFCQGRKSFERIGVLQDRQGALHITQSSQRRTKLATVNAQMALLNSYWRPRASYA